MPFLAAILYVAALSILSLLEQKQVIEPEQEDSSNLEQDNTSNNSSAEKSVPAAILNNFRCNYSSSKPQKFHFDGVEAKFSYDIKKYLISKDSYKKLLGTCEGLGTGQATKEVIEIEGKKRTYPQSFIFSALFASFYPIECEDCEEDENIVPILDVDTDGTKSLHNITNKNSKLDPDSPAYHDESDPPGTPPQNDNLISDSSDPETSDDHRTLVPDFSTEDNLDSLTPLTQSLPESSLTKEPYHLTDKFLLAALGIGIGSAGAFILKREYKKYQDRVKAEKRERLIEHLKNARIDFDKIIKTLPQEKQERARKAVSDEDYTKFEDDLCSLCYAKASTPICQDCASCKDCANCEDCTNCKNCFKNKILAGSVNAECGKSSYPFCTGEDENKIVTPFHLRKLGFSEKEIYKYKLNTLLQIVREEKHHKACLIPNCNYAEATYDDDNIINCPHCEQITCTFCGEDPHQNQDKCPNMHERCQQTIDKDIAEAKNPDNFMYGGKSYHSNLADGPRNDRQHLFNTGNRPCYRCGFMQNRASECNHYTCQNCNTRGLNWVYGVDDNVPPRHSHVSCYGPMLYDLPEGVKPWMSGMQNPNNMRNSNNMRNPDRRGGWR